MRHSLAEVCSKENSVGTQEIVENHVDDTRRVQSNAPLKIAEAIADAADDAKGKEVVLLDVSKNFGLADYFIIVSARSDRHSQGIANKITQELADLGIEPYSIQGMEDGQWVIVDCSDVVVHIFYEPLRQRYDLESLWLNAQTIDRSKLAVPTNASHKRAPNRQRETVLA